MCNRLINNQTFTGLNKRAWNDFQAGYGKRSDAADFYDDEFEDNAPGKRAWNSGFAGGMGKRSAQHKDLKRAWNSGFAGGMGKRAWNSGFAGGMGKRAWNSGFAGGMGKRAWNSGFAGGMGKRTVENFQETANEPGEYTAPRTFCRLRCILGIHGKPHGIVGIRCFDALCMLTFLGASSLILCPLFQRCKYLTALPQD